MLALLAVATLAASDPTHDIAAPSRAFTPLARLYLDRSSPGGFLRAPSRCKDAARLQTGFEPALLFRERDRADARARRLIDLPPGELCLVGAPLEARSTLK